MTDQERAELKQFIYGNYQFEPLDVRAWIEEEERFLHSISDDGLPVKLSTFFLAIEQIEQMAGHRIPIMPFSGCEDTYRRKIYADDVILTDDGRYFRVFFGDGHFWLSRNTGNGWETGTLWENRDKLKVIGDIWQDPELWTKVY